MEKTLLASLGNGWEQGVQQTTKKVHIQDGDSAVVGHKFMGLI
jgi:hypothetical protein